MNSESQCKSTVFKICGRSLTSMQNFWPNSQFLNVFSILTIWRPGVSCQYNTIAKLARLATLIEASPAQQFLSETWWFIFVLWIVPIISRIKYLPQYIGGQRTGDLFYSIWYLIIHHLQLIIGDFMSNLKLKNVLFSILMGSKKSQKKSRDSEKGYYWELCVIRKNTTLKIKSWIN